MAITSNIKEAFISKKPILSKEQIQQIDDLEDWTSRYQSPLQHMEHSLHGWVAYLIIPIFALANAGVLISSDLNIDTLLVINIIICLVLGKSIGITAMVLFAKKIGLVKIPEDITIRHIIGTSFLAGIGFTMAIFVSNLAFKDDPVYNLSAKMGILIGSVIAAILGYVILRIKAKDKFESWYIEERYAGREIRDKKDKRLKIAALKDEKWKMIDERSMVTRLDLTVY